MQRLFRSIPSVKNARIERERRNFQERMELLKVSFSGPLIPERTAQCRTILLDASNVMEREPCVVEAAAPFERMEIANMRRQAGRMMPGICAALLSDGYPLLREYAVSLGIKIPMICEKYSCVQTPEWDSHGRMTGIFEDAAGRWAFSWGGVEGILKRCDKVLEGYERPLCDEEREGVFKLASAMRESGLDVMTFSMKRLNDDSEETGHTYLGLVGIGCRILPNAASKIRTLRMAGLSPIILSDRTLCRWTLNELGVRIPPVTRSHMLTGQELRTLDLRSLHQRAERLCAVEEAEAEGLERLLTVLGMEKGGALALDAELPGAVCVSLDGRPTDLVCRQGGLEGLARVVTQCRIFAQSCQEITEGR